MSLINFNFYIGFDMIYYVVLLCHLENILPTWFVNTIE